MLSGCGSPPLVCGSRKEILGWDADWLSRISELWVQGRDFVSITETEISEDLCMHVCAYSHVQVCTHMQEGKSTQKIKGSLVYKYRPSLLFPGLIRVLPVSVLFSLIEVVSF